MTSKKSLRTQVDGCAKEELGSLIATNRSLRHEVVSLMLDIAILRERDEDCARRTFGTDNSQMYGTHHARRAVRRW
jgi:hypothetical protein